MPTASLNMQPPQVHTMARYTIVVSKMARKVPRGIAMDGFWSKKCDFMTKSDYVRISKPLVCLRAKYSCADIIPAPINLMLERLE